MSFESDPVTVVRKDWVLDVKSSWKGWWGVTGGYGNVSSKSKQAIDSGCGEWEAHVYRVQRDDDGNVVMTYKKNEALDVWWPKDSPIQMFSSTAPLDDVDHILRHPGYEVPSEWTNVKAVSSHLVGGHFKGMEACHIAEWKAFFDNMHSLGELPTSNEDDRAFQWHLPALYKRAKQFMSLPPTIYAADIHVPFNPEPEYEVLLHKHFTKKDRARDRIHRVENHQQAKKKQQEAERANELRRKQEACSAAMAVEIEAAPRVRNGKPAVVVDTRRILGFDTSDESENEE